MTMQAPTTDPAPPPPPPMPVMCDQDPEQLATHAYVWAWGQTGVCCAKYVATLQQTAEQLGRSIQFSVLNPHAAPPLERPERVRLKSEIYALEAELEETKGRGAEMLRQNTLLARSVQALTVRGRETESQLADLKALHVVIEAEREKRDAEHGDLVDELDRLRLIVGAMPVDDGTLDDDDVDDDQDEDETVAEIVTDLREQVASLGAALEQRDEDRARLQTELDRLRAAAADDAERNAFTTQRG